MASKLQPEVFSRRAVCERNMIVSNVVEEVNVIPVQSQGRSNGVHGSIAPSLVEESTITIEAAEEIEIRGGPKPVKVSDLKVGPLGIVSEGLAIGSRRLTKWHLL